MSNLRNTGLLPTSRTTLDQQGLVKTYRVTTNLTPTTNPYAGGDGPDEAMVLYFSRCGTSPDILFSWSGISGTAGAATKLAWTQVIPAECRPKTDHYVSVPIINGGTSATGLMKIGSNGTLTYATAADAAFSDSDTCAVRASSVTYCKL